MGQTAKYDHFWSETTATYDPDTLTSAARAIGELVSRNIGSTTAERALDIGCGDGAVTRFVRPHCRHLTGVDLSSVALASARRWLDDFRVVDLDAPDPLPFQPETFDLVTMSEVIEHLTRPENVLAAIARLLKPTGRLVLTTPNQSWWRYRLENWAGRIPEVTNWDYQHIFVQNLFDLRAMIRRSGLVPIEEDVQVILYRKYLPAIALMGLSEWIAHRGERTWNEIRRNLLGYRLCVVARPAPTRTPSTSPPRSDESTRKRPAPSAAGVLS